VFSLVVTERGGAQRRLSFNGSEVSVGRLDDNDVVLPKNNVSKHHARLVLKDERFLLEDMGSTNGTYVNGRKIASPIVVAGGDKIYIGDFILAIAPATGAASSAPSRPATEPAPPHGSDPGLGAPGGVDPLEREPRAAARAAVGVQGRGVAPPAPAGAASRGGPTVPLPPPASSLPGPGRQARGDEQTGERPKRPSMPPRVEDPDSGSGPATSPAVLAPSVRLQGALNTLMERLEAEFDIHQPHESAFPSKHQATLQQLLKGLAREGVIGPDLDHRFLGEAAVSEAVGLGPLDRLLNNRAVREVVVDGPARILADLGGGLSPVSSFFSSSDAVRAVAARLLARAEQPLEALPVQTAQLLDGSQVQILSPPLTAGELLISVRVPPRTTTSPEALVTEGALSSEMLSTLRAAIQRRVNMLIVGGGGSGLSTTVSALCSMCQDHERIIAIQQSPSLSIQHPYVLPLYRGGAAELDLSTLLSHASRLRGDRLVMDDLEPEDALSALLSASASRGVISSMHASSIKAALQRLQVFARRSLGGGGAETAALMVEAFELVILLEMDAQGVRRMKEISELSLDGEGHIAQRALFSFDGSFRKSKHGPSFLAG